MKIRFGIIVIISVVMSLNLYSQKGTTANFMTLIPQQSDYNPAYSSPYNIYIGLPALSGIEAQINNNAFSLGHAMSRRGDTALIDAYKLLGGMSEQNIVGAELKMDLLRFGFQFKEKNFLHFGVDLNGEMNVLLQKRTLSFLLKGPGAYLDREDNVLNDNKLSLNLYSSIYAGYTRKINDKLNLGLRARVIFGAANIHTENSDIHLRIDNGDDPDIVPYSYFIQPDVKMKASISGISDSGLIDNLKNIDSDFSSAMKNIGLGLDIGATYQLTDNLLLSASISDIGFINWKANTKVLSSGGQSREFVFSGLGNLSDLINDDNFDLKNALTNLKDSLVEYLDIKDTVGDNYRTRLNTKYTLGAMINFSEKNQFGIMWRFQSGEITKNIVSLAYTRYIGNNVALTFSNSIINSNFFNFGGGVSFNLGSFQFYLIVDKLNSFRVINMRAANVQLGINFVFNQKNREY